MRKKLTVTTIFLIGMIALNTLTGCSKEGAEGKSGFNSLIKTSIEQPGDNCVTGGLKVTVGLDSNRNGILDNYEINATSYVCNKSPETYSAVITQTGENPPTASIINNTINLNITWSRTSQGHYKGVLNKQLNLAKSIVLCNNIGVLCYFKTNTEIDLDNSCGVNAYCDNFSGLNIEVKAY